MYQVRAVDSLAAPELAPYRTLRRHQEHIARGIFVAEGEKVVRRLLASELDVVSLLLTPAWLERLRPDLEPRSAPELSVHVAAQALLEEIVGFPLHQGIMAVGRVPLPASVAAVLRAHAPPRFLVALDGLSGPENVGVIVRNCVAFGVQALIVGETSSSPYLRRSVRNSMGTIFRLPVVAATSLADTLAELARAGIPSIAADAQATELGLADLDLTGDVCLVFGSEADGLRTSTLAACARRAVIPMTPGTDSLNVANASAVFLYEVMRQRRR